MGKIEEKIIHSLSTQKCKIQSILDVVYIKHTISDIFRAPLSKGRHDHVEKLFHMLNDESRRKHDVPKWRQRLYCIPNDVKGTNIIVIYIILELENGLKCYNYQNQLFQA